MKTTMKTTIKIEKWNTTSELSGKFGCFGRFGHAKQIIASKGTIGEEDYEPYHEELLLFHNQEKAVKYAETNGYHTVIHYEKAD